jgi:hypothetical protein
MKTIFSLLALAVTFSGDAMAQQPPSGPPPAGCQCAQGHWYDPNVKSCVTTACEVVKGMPDGDKGGGFFAWNGHLFTKTACTNPNTNTCLNGPAGTICTFAGNGTAGTAPDGSVVKTSPITPGTLAFHSKFNALLFTENNKIRGVHPMNDTFYTLAGSGSPGYLEGPALSARMQDISGLTTHPTLGYVYFSQFNSYALLRSVNLGSSVTTSLIAGDPNVANQSVDGPATAGAKMWWPRDISLSSSGVLYFVEVFSKKLRTITNSNQGATVCTFPGVSNVSGFALGSGTDVFLLDATGNRVLRSSLSCAAPVQLATGLTGPMIYDGAKNRLVLKKGANQVVEIKGVNSNSTVLAPTVLAGSGAFGNAGDTGAGPAAQLKGVNGLAIGPGGHLYISTGDKIRVLKQ